MEHIKLLDKSRNYEVMDLWLRTTTKDNSFVEPDFWQTHYDLIKKQYINGNDIFAYMEDDKILAFVCVSDDNRIAGLFVDPAYQNIGIGKKLIDFLKSEYSLLHIEIYAKNRKALSFSAKSGFLIDGAKRHPYNNEVMYTMIWRE